MKKFAVILFLVGVLTFSAVGTAVAQTYPLTLCMNGWQPNLIATYLGMVGGKSVFALNGWIDHSEGDIPVSGTATIAGSVIHWGFTLESVSKPGVWEFTTDFGGNGTGSWQRLFDTEDSGEFSVSPGPCP